MAVSARDGFRQIWLVFAVDYAGTPCASIVATFALRALPQSDCGTYVHSVQQFGYLASDSKLLITTDVAVMLRYGYARVDRRPIASLQCIGA